MLDMASDIVLKSLPIDDASKTRLIEIRTNIFFDATDRLSEDVFTGKLTVAQFQKKMQAEIRQLWSSNAATSKGGWDEMSWQDWGRLGPELKSQYNYLKGFAQTIADNAQTISLSSIKARARLYGKAAATASMMMQAGVEISNILPWLPKDGSTECLVGCKCRWELSVTKVKPDKRQVVTAIWRLGKAEHCDDCVDRNDHVEVFEVSANTKVPSVIGGI
jgi:hypothetical protein